MNRADVTENRGLQAGMSTPAEATRPCLICLGLRRRPVFQERSVAILQCRDCGHIFSSAPAEPHYAGFWGEKVADEGHFYWAEARRRMHGDFLGKFVVGRSGRLLDMGCGLGFFLKAVQPYRSWEAHGCEISPAAVRYARENLGLSNIQCSQPEAATFPDGHFDLITLWDVVDHLSEPDPALSRCHALLKEDGLLFIRTPNISNQLFRARMKKLLRGMRPDLSYLMAHDHAHHYSAQSIRRLLARNGFTRIEFTHLHPIQSASYRCPVASCAKRLCFGAVRGLATITGGRLNFDNLFVVARKSDFEAAQARIGLIRERGK